MEPVILDVVETRGRVVVELGFLHGTEEPEQMETEVVGEGHLDLFDIRGQHTAQEEAFLEFHINIKVFGFCFEMLSFEGESHVGVIFICFKENLRLWYFPH
jgi:hypothetical protein